MNIRRLYYAERAGGTCFLVEAGRLSSAAKLAREEVGSSDFRYVRLASKEDVAWILGMGGGVVFGGKNVFTTEDKRIK